MAGQFLPLIGFENEPVTHACTDRNHSETNRVPFARNGTLKMLKDSRINYFG